MGMDAQTMQIRLEANLSVSKREQISELLVLPFNEQVKQAKRMEEMGESASTHIWKKVNKHLGTSATSYQELIEQMGVARFGHRPKVADVFCGSGQIPFEAARLGCDVYASDLNPVASMLTWGAMNIVGADPKKRLAIEKAQVKLVETVQTQIDELEFDIDGNGWEAKAYLYCLEVVCPETGWRVPVLPTLIVSASKYIVVKLLPNAQKKNYDIKVHYCADKTEMELLSNGTLDDGYLIHSPDGTHSHRIKISTIRGDYREGNENKNRLRLWGKEDFIPAPEDIFQERLYCIQWTKNQGRGQRNKVEFRSVSQEDLSREQKVINYVKTNLSSWQTMGYVPDMLIEKGYNTDQPIREKGWTHWHHLFNYRQLMMLGLTKKALIKQVGLSAELTVFFGRLLDWSSKLCYYGTGAARESIAHTFYNQALNTFYNYGVRPFSFAAKYLLEGTYNYPILSKTEIHSHPALDIEIENDIYITDPPYGDSVKYEEITEFFIGWLRKNPPEEFSHWTWDSRRSLAIKGEDEGFRRGMIAAYRKISEMMPDNGIQVLMFTHQSGTIWADMANIIWAAGLQVTAAWYVVTESDSAVRQGANVKGTIILILRKRHEIKETFRDDLGWDIEEAVKEQVESLVGLDQSVRATGAEGLYTDADLQMAGYAAALKVLTAYSIIDGKDMVTEAEAPRVPGKKTFVDDLIEFAVQTAVQFLVPTGFEASVWKNLQPVERFYLKMADVEFQGGKTLDNYQNFAKAFKVVHFDQVISDASKANAARLKLSLEFKSTLMSGDVEIAGTPLRTVLFGLYEINRDIDIEEVLAHLMEVYPNYMANKALLSTMADYLAQKRQSLKTTKNFRPDKEAEAARILAEAIRNHRL